jgi:hypothetical protein
MMSCMSWWIRRAVVALGYVGGLLGTAVVLNSQDDGTRRGWVAWASTNLANLGHHPLSALVASAFVVDDGIPYAWAVLAAVGLLGLAWRLGPWRTLAVVAGAHLLGTAISEGIVAWRVHRASLPASARELTDVGPSYIVVAALIGAVVAGPWQVRLAAGACFVLLAPSLFGGLADLDVAAVGHVCSIVIGAGLTFALQSARQ